jgi:hypothetical protein
MAKLTSRHSRFVLVAIRRRASNWNKNFINRMAAASELSGGEEGRPVLSTRAYTKARLGIAILLTGRLYTDLFTSMLSEVSRVRPNVYVLAHSGRTLAGILGHSRGNLGHRPYSYVPRVGQSGRGRVHFRPGIGDFPPRLAHHHHLCGFVALVVDTPIAETA